MARFKPKDVIDLAIENPIIPLFTHDDSVLAKEVLRSCYAGGVRVFEYTNRSRNARKVFDELVQCARSEMPDLAIGVGTIFSADEARTFIDADADFIIQPILDQGVAQVCHSKEVSWIPGAMTVSEIYHAHQLHAAIVKIFPAHVLGVEFVKALRGPMPHTLLMATGGVEPNKDNLDRWLSAGASCVGMGSQLFTKEILKEKELTRLRNVVERCVLRTKKVKTIL